MHPPETAQVGGAQVIRIGTASANPAGYTHTRSRQPNPRAGRRSGAPESRAAVSLPNSDRARRRRSPALVMPPRACPPRAARRFCSLAHGRPVATSTELRSLHRPTSTWSTQAPEQPRARGTRSPRTVKRIGGGQALKAARRQRDRCRALRRRRVRLGHPRTRHGPVFANASRHSTDPRSHCFPPAATSAAAPARRFEPTRQTSIPPALVEYLKNIKPATPPSPTGPRRLQSRLADRRRTAISTVTQAEIDTLLETSARATATEEPSLPLAE